MKALRRLLLIAALALIGIRCGPSPATAQNTQSSEAMQAAMKLVLLSIDSMPNLANQTTAQVWPALESSLRARYPQIDGATLNQLRNEFERIQTSLMSEMMVEAPAIYVRHFTAEELKEIMAFYQTRTGAKTLKVMPQAMAEIQTSMMPRLTALPEQVNQAFDKILRQRGYVK
jgi:hypothetical protein